MSDFNASEFTCIQIFRELVICFYEIREQSFGKTPLVYIILSFQTQRQKRIKKRNEKTVREKYFCEKKNKLNFTSLLQEVGGIATLRGVVPLCLDNGQ